METLGRILANSLGSTDRSTFTTLPQDQFHQAIVFLQNGVVVSVTTPSNHLRQPTTLHAPTVTAERYKTSNIGSFDVQVHWKQDTRNLMKVNLSWAWDFSQNAEKSITLAKRTLFGVQQWPSIQTHTHTHTHTTTTPTTTTATPTTMTPTTGNNNNNNNNDKQQQQERWRKEFIPLSRWHFQYPLYLKDHLIFEGYIWVGFSAQDGRWNLYDLSFQRRKRVHPVDQSNHQVDCENRTIYFNLGVKSIF